MVRIGSARIDENGNIRGGKAGNQSGKELMIQDYYKHPKEWDLYRPISPEVAKGLAQSMIDACNNKNIGYDQGNNMDIFRKQEKYGSLKDIAEPTECDCAKLIRACCIDNGFDPGDFYTANEGAALSKSGMFQPKIEVKDTTIMYEGDILVTRSKGHTCIIVEGEPREVRNVEINKGNFLDIIVPLIQKYAPQYDIKVVSAIIAQAIIESNWGESGLAKYNNLFGMKCGSKWTGKSVNMKTKEEYTAGTLTDIKANFRAYDSVEEGVKGYFEFISTKRYAKLKEATTPREYLELIKAAGYATSSTYVQTNMNIVEKYSLTKYDTQTSQSAPQRTENPYMDDGTLLRIDKRGEAVKWLQWTLNQKGYNLVVDGIFGVKTQMAVKSFQYDSKITVDGIVGKQTRKALKG